MDKFLRGLRPALGTAALVRPRLLNDMQDMVWSGSS